MKEVVSKNLCTGCTACASICPKSAITMIKEKDGFKYPQIEQSRCIDCGLCVKTCPIINTKQNIALNQCYVGYAKSEDVKKNASSGGIFHLIANYVLENSGIVIGAAFDKKNKLKHIAIESKQELEKLKGSKYLQSDLNDIFIYIKENIKNRLILFVGVPCQVAGLKAYLKKDYENLICIDLICHGVPSPKLFDKYIEELELIQNDKLVDYKFRDKSTGWDTYSNKAIFKESNITELQNKNQYMRLFLSDVALRESCYNCKFKLDNKYSDITLGDFWGVKNYYPEMYNKNGVSAIILNTSKGINIFDTIKNNVDYKKCKLEEIISGNPSLIKSAQYTSKRRKFFNDLETLSISELTRKYAKRKNNIIKMMIIKILIKLGIKK